MFEWHGVGRLFREYTQIPKLHRSKGGQNCIYRQSEHGFYAPKQYFVDCYSRSIHGILSWCDSDMMSKKQKRK